ncbi:ATP nucleotide 3'-pyrophosphokinase [Streptomyces sp. MMG1121]|uniref:ATP nucleotide 3'-pyrophosphokinase n=1 Tax=Streptomyces sp. MMG1121 TaxID=1415544 RepID=UPI0006AEC469|nr:ATP nucleotide 3'-pyrophosphokinase [Streptomyces sp. MMG1121]KOV61275.1 ATP nucleotide 3'-pyrophosphokinase [Streptomyces sp. MMG1121]
MTVTTTHSIGKGLLAAALTTAVALSAGPSAAAATHDGWKGAGGLTLNSADNAKVDAYLNRARQAEKSISTDVRTAALASGAELVGFDHRLKSADSLKRKVATSLKDNRGQNVDTVLARLTDAVRYTLQWTDTTYTTGVTDASAVLAAWGNDSTKWSNTWNRTSGYKGLNTGWRAPRSGQLFEIQFHTPESKHAQEVTHLLYEEQRLPSTTEARKRQLQAQQDAVFNAVPVPPGADRLAPPANPTAPVPVPATP